MFDEFFGDFDSLHETTKDEVRTFISAKQTAWIAMSNVYYGNRNPPADVDLEIFIKRQLKPSRKKGN